MSDLPPVLDPCCGGRMMWFDREHPAVLFGDIRRETLTQTDTDQGRQRYRQRLRLRSGNHHRSQGRTGDRFVLFSVVDGVFNFEIRKKL